MIIGQAPSRTSEVPLEGLVGRRVCEWTGLSTWEELNARFALANLLPKWPGKDGKGDAFPLAEARRHAEGLFREVLMPEEWDLILLLGWNVAGAFGVPAAVGYLNEFAAAGIARLQEWDALPGVRAPRFVVLPHPSGVNRWLNDAASVDRLRGYMRSLL